MVLNRPCSSPFRRNGLHSSPCLSLSGKVHHQTAGASGSRVCLFASFIPLRLAGRWCEVLGILLALQVEHKQKFDTRHIITLNGLDWFLALSYLYIISHPWVKHQCQLSPFRFFFSWLKLLHIIRSFPIANWNVLQNSKDKEYNQNSFLAYCHITWFTLLILINIYSTEIPWQSYIA